MFSPPYILLGRRSSEDALGPRSPEVEFENYSDKEYKKRKLPTKEQHLTIDLMPYEEPPPDAKALLHYAVYTKNFTTAKQIIEADPGSVTQRHPYSGKLPIDHAAENGDAEMFFLLLDQSPSTI